MKRRRIWLLPVVFRVGVCLSVLTCIVVNGQNSSPPSLGEVRTLLQSSDTKDRAWGAWWVCQLRETELTPILERNLSDHLSGTTWRDNADPER